MITGSIDLIDDDKVIYDYKTVEGDYISTNQLDIYCYGYWANTGKEIKEGGIINVNIQEGSIGVDTASNRPLSKNTYLNEIEGKIKTIIDNIVVNNYQTTCDAEKCKNCPFNKICSKIKTLKH